MDIEWNGITNSKYLDPESAALRHQLADAAKSGDWPQAIEVLSRNPKLANSTRPEGKALDAPLHQAAYGGAPVEVAEQLIALGAWRSLKNSNGEKPVDIAVERKHGHLVQILTPEYKHQVPSGILAEIQKHFHRVILDRVSHLIKQHNIRLPELEPLLELERPHMWFAVPGMMGGFSFWLEAEGEETKLIAESWSRMDFDSAERCEINAFGSRFVDEKLIE